MTAIGTFAALTPRLDTKFGQIAAELATKLSAPTNAGTFVPTLIDLSMGQIEYDRYTQTGAIAFALNGAVTPSMGGSALVNILGGGFAVTFPANFVGLGGLSSGTVLQSGREYPFVFRHAEDWAGVGQDRVLVQTDGLPHATNHVTGGDDTIRDATAILDGLATAAQVRSLSVLTAAARTSLFTATPGTLEEINTSGGAFSCNLPATPTRGIRAAFIDKTDSWGTNALTIQRNGSTIEGLAEDIVASGGKLVSLYYDGSTWRFEYSGGISPLTALQEVLIVAASDETSGLIDGTSKVKFRMPFAMNVTEVRASVGTAPEGAAIIVDINEVVGGVPTSILGTKLSIDDGQKTSMSAASPATITDALLGNDAEITIDIDQTGSTIAGAGLKVQLHGLRV